MNQLSSSSEVNSQAVDLSVNLKAINQMTLHYIKLGSLLLNFKRTPPEPQGMYCTLPCLWRGHAEG
jgi:hypothetical protein